MLGEASIFFCFLEDSLDQPHHPNKLVLARTTPTVFDVCGTIKALFYPNQVKSTLPNSTHLKDGDPEMFICTWSWASSHRIRWTKPKLGARKWPVQCPSHFSTTCVQDGQQVYLLCTENEGTLGLSPQFMQGMLLLPSLSLYLLCAGQQTKLREAWHNLLPSHRSYSTSFRPLSLLTCLSCAVVASEQLDDDRDPWSVLQREDYDGQYEVPERYWPSKVCHPWISLLCRWNSLFLPPF